MTAKIYSKHRKWQFIEPGIATNLVVNLTYYGYGRTPVQHLPGSAKLQWQRRPIHSQKTGEPYVAHRHTGPAISNADYGKAVLSAIGHAMQ